MNPYSNIDGQKFIRDFECKSKEYLVKLLRVGKAFLKYLKRLTKF
jgi:hypothetical protein